VEYVAQRYEKCLENVGEKPEGKYHLRDYV